MHRLKRLNDEVMTRRGLKRLNDEVTTRRGSST
jgi:hypothetical protein